MSAIIKIENKGNHIVNPLLNLQGRLFDTVDAARKAIIDRLSELEHLTDYADENEMCISVGLLDFASEDGVIATIEEIPESILKTANDKRALAYNLLRESQHLLEVWLSRSATDKTYEGVVPNVRSGHAEIEKAAEIVNTASWPILPDLKEIVDDHDASGVFNSQN